MSFDVVALLVVVLNVVDSTLVTLPYAKADALTATVWKTTTFILNVTFQVSLCV